MELTHAAVDDLLARLGRGGGHLYLPAGLDPQALTELLAGRFGVPRTLVLDGFTDPTVGECAGAAVLDPFAGRVVRMRVWACGDRWVATGTAHDAAGVLRPVLVAAHRQVPHMPAPAPNENEDEEGAGVDWVRRLREITGWSRPARRPEVDWARVQARLGTRLPGDYRRMVATFGAGAFDGHLDLNQEPWTDLREDGLLIWAVTEHKDRYCWRMQGEDPDGWPVVVRSSADKDTVFACPAAQFVCRILLDAHHPYTLAGYFDTHWFMTYDDGP
ncbi:hypothetical protein [Streptomyces sp. 1222.5]|uniref:hypothetical protein n=1 Tax=Streptomyces sp. 1222.5 TaxID=1881026 RepID=UPI003D743D9C